jgi:hypothetical protein
MLTHNKINGVNFNKIIIYYMVLFFFYKNLTDKALIKNINTKSDISDGYALIEKYDTNNDNLIISDKPKNNNKILCGKIVDFNMKLEDIMYKINEMDECKLNNKTTYTMESIWVSKIKNGCVYKAYIIY